MSQERMRKLLTLAGLAAVLGLSGCSDGLDDLRAEVGDDPAAWLPRLVMGGR